MKRGSTIVLQIVTILVGIGALAFLLLEPHLEGRNAHASVFEIYFKDPFLACAYTASIAFFVALWQTYKLLGLIGRHEMFSQASLKVLRTIKYCATALVTFAVGAEAWLFVVERGKDDIAGGVFMGLLLIAVSGTGAIAAAVFERTLKHAVDLQSENDLTV